MPVILHSAFFIHPSPAIAARLQSETTLPIKWIVARVQIGTAKGAQSVLQHLAQSHDQRKTAKALEPCAQLEFQSTVGPLLRPPSLGQPEVVDWALQGDGRGGKGSLDVGKFFIRDGEPFG